MICTCCGNPLEPPARKIPIAEIQAAVAHRFRLRPAELTSHRRAREIVRPRQIAMYLARELTPRSLPEIGRVFGRRDHTTVLHAIRTIGRLREIDADLDGDVRELEVRFGLVDAEAPDPRQAAFPFSFAGAA